MLPLLEPFCCPSFDHAIATSIGTITGAVQIIRGREVTGSRGLVESNRFISLFAFAIVAFGSSGFGMLMVNHVGASVYEKVKTKTHNDIVVFFIVTSSC